MEEQNKNGENIRISPTKIKIFKIPEYQLENFKNNKISTFFDFVSKYKIKGYEQQIIKNIKNLDCAETPLFDLMDSYVEFFRTMYAARRYYHIISKFKTTMEEIIGDDIGTNSRLDDDKKCKIIKTALTTNFPNNSSMNKENQEALKQKLTEYRYVYTFLNGLRLLTLPNLDGLDLKSGNDVIERSLKTYKSSRDYNNLKSIEEKNKEPKYKYKIAQSDKEYCEPFIDLFNAIKQIDKANVQNCKTTLSPLVLGCKKMQEDLDFLECKKNNYINLLFGDDGIIKL